MVNEALVLHIVAGRVKVTTGAALTVIVIGLEVAGLPVTQDKDDVITTVITSPSLSVEEVKLAPVAPVTFTPLICH
jgi:uncharacterized protein YpuA (DUF1002 family)